LGSKRVRISQRGGQKTWKTEKKGGKIEGIGPSLFRGESIDVKMEDAPNET